jgi:hypothetical protein
MDPTIFTKTDREVQTYVGMAQNERFADLAVNGDVSDSSDASAEGSFEDLYEQQEELALKSRGVIGTLLPIIFAGAYIPIFDFTLQVGQNAFTQGRKRIAISISTFLAVPIIGYDIYRLTQTYSLYYLIAIAARILMFPLLVMFNIAVPFIERPEDRVVRVIMRVFPVYVLLLELVLAVCAIWSPAFVSSGRLTELAPPSALSVPAWDVNRSSVNAACVYRYNGLSLLDAIGFALGGYDVERAPQIFESQMAYFFGRAWRERIVYDVNHIDDSMLYIKYFDRQTNVTIYGFRGLMSASELSLWIHMLLFEYILPPLQELAPFYELIIETWFETVAPMIQGIGHFFFEPRSVARDFIEKVIDRFTEAPHTIFVGINLGGLIAKALGMITKRPGISFLSYPAFNDIFATEFGFDESAAWHIINIFNYEGLFTLPERDIGTNLGIPWVEAPSWIANTIFPNVNRDTVYQSFCVYAQICGAGPQFDEYCGAAVGPTWPAIRAIVDEEYEESSRSAA